MITGFVVLVSITTFLVCFVDCSSQTGIVGNGADVYVLEPESTFAVQYGEITFKIGVQLHPGSSLLHKNQICIREIGSSAGELCSEQSIFTVSGFSSGTHVITASLRSFADKESFQKGEYSLMGSSETVIDSVDGSYLVNHAMDSALSHRILQSDAKLSRLDYLYFPNSADRERDGGDKDITPNEYKIIGIAAMAMKEAERISGRAAVLRRKKVAFFMTTVSGIPPSDRYRDWLCEHAVFLEHGYELAIITGDDGKHPCCLAISLFKLCGLSLISVFLSSAQVSMKGYLVFAV